METSAAPALGITPGMKYGETARGPRAVLRAICSSKISTEPCPVERRQPTIVGSTPATWGCGASSSER